MRSVLDIYGEPVNTPLSTQSADMKFYRDLEFTHGELIEKLIMAQAKRKGEEKKEEKNVNAAILVRATSFKKS